MKRKKNKQQNPELKSDSNRQESSPAPGGNEMIKPDATTQNRKSIHEPAEVPPPPGKINEPGMNEENSPDIENQITMNMQNNEVIPENQQKPEEKAETKVDDIAKSTDTSNTEINFVIENQLTLDNINEIKQKMEKMLKNQKEVKVELVNIQSLDLAGVQLLYSLHTTAQKQNKFTFITMDSAEGVKELLHSTGLFRILNQIIYK